MTSNLALVFKQSFGEESYGLVYHNEQNGMYEVYEIPQYGGQERLEGVFNEHEYEAAVAYAKSFT